MTFNTGNPIGSTDARDLSDNADNFDTALGTTAATWVDRFGVTRDSFEGRLAKGSFYRVGTFAAGYTLTNMRQTLEYNGLEYSWSGAFPKVVAAGSTPTPVAEGNWVDRSGDLLRQEIRETTFQTLKRSMFDAGYTLVSGSFEGGGTITSASDVLWYQNDGKCYAWGGALPKIVPIGSNPTTTGGLGAGAWIDASNSSIKSQLDADSGANLVGYTAENTYGQGTVGAALGESAYKSKISTKGMVISKATLPRLFRKLDRYAHGATGQNEFTICGFGSSVGNGATLPDPATQAPVAKFFEYWNKYVNKGQIWPFQFFNDSVNGSIAAEFSTAWNAQIATTTTPDLAVLCYGMNDFFTANYNAGQTFGIGGFEAQLRAAIKTCHNAGCDVVLITTPHPHSTRSSWSMPSNVAMSWPVASAAPVADSALYPTVANSIVTIDYDGASHSVPASHRFLRGNECIRRVAAETGCLLVDVEWLWFDAIYSNSEDALFDVGVYNHPNLKGHTLSYWIGIEQACKMLGEFTAADNRTPYSAESVAAGGGYLYENPHDASVSVVHDGLFAYVEDVRNVNGQQLRTLESNGTENRNGGKYYEYNALPNVTTRVGLSREIYGRSGLAANATVIIPLPIRAGSRVLISGWTGNWFPYAQMDQLMVFNSEGTLIINNMSKIDNSTAAIYSYAASGNNLIITTKLANTVIRALVENFL